MASKTSSVLQSIHVSRVRWTANLMEHIGEESETAYDMAEWFIGDYNAKGYQWLNIPLAPNFPRAEVVSKRDRERAAKPENKEDYAWLLEEQDGKFSKMQRRTRRSRMLKDLLQKQIRKAKTAQPEQELEANLKFLANKLSLGETAADYLLLLSNIEESNAARGLLRWAVTAAASESYSHAYESAVAILLDRPREDIQKLLAADSPLNKSGILQFAEAGDKVRFSHLFASEDISLSRFFLRLINRARLTEETLSSQVFGNTVTTRLTLADFGYMSDKLDMIVRYVESVRDGRWDQGGAVVLEGEPGVGKSQLAGVIAVEAKLPYYYIGQSKSTDMRRVDMALDTEMSRKEVFAELRFKNRLAERLNIKAGFVVEESDSILRKALVQESDKTNKGFLNMVLEELRSPVIFTTNSIGAMERATIRRILPVVPVELQPDHVLAGLMVRIAKDAKADLPQKDALDLIERYPGMSIGEVERITLMVCASTRADDGEGTFLPRLDMALRLGRRALNGGLEEPAMRTVVPDGYDPTLAPLSFPHASVVRAFQRAIQKGQTPHLAMVGHPGAGKRTLARHLFQQAGKRVDEVTFVSLLGLASYGDIIELFQTAAASQKGLLVSGAQPLLLAHEANRDFLFLRVMREFDVPTIMTADVIPGNAGFSYQYTAATRETQHPRAVHVHNSVTIPTMPVSMRENFSLVVQFTPLKDKALERAFFAVVGEHAPGLSALKDAVTFADLISVRRNLDFLDIGGEQRAQVALDILKQLKAPLLAGEHSITALEEPAQANGQTNGAGPKPFILN